ncbi:MAG TPA: hypothetical protein VEP46_02285 [Vicinamibacterales bacterium]|nr:hypothetical protein [Vicinamibacterales bacterium]
MEQEIARFRRPLAASGCGEHPSQIALERDLQALAVRLEEDGLDQTANGVSGRDSAILVLL